MFDLFCCSSLQTVQSALQGAITGKREDVEEQVGSALSQYSRQTFSYSALADKSRAERGKQVHPSYLKLMKILPGKEKRLLQVIRQG